MDDEQIERLMALLEELGWQLAIPEQYDDTPGFIIGCDEYVDSIVDKLDLAEKLQEMDNKEKKVLH